MLKGNSKECRKVRVDNVVLIGDDNKKRLDWPLAKIKELVIGRDGIPRVAIS